ncbi:MAG: hypothetical protein KA314_04980 [Chloroflexi bacterium]|nr:hypothetical protein [Chloroflexota bacterium]
MNEATMQAILMRYAMEEKHHEIAIPNITEIYRWEADVLSVTRAFLTHEFEIKVSKADYLADRKKKRKHEWLAAPPLTDYWGAPKAHTPNYFWFATSGFEIDNLPPYAGWLVITPDKSRRYGYSLKIRKDAPKLHQLKLEDKARLNLSRWLSYKLKNMYQAAYLSGATAKVEL